MALSDQIQLRKDSITTLKQQLAERETELAIIDSIQQGLASHLDVQSIYDLVGNEIRDIFNAQVVMISTYDRQTDTVEHRYAIERGERVYAPGHHPCRGFRTQIVQTRQPVLVNTNVAEQAACLGQPTLPGTRTPKSWLGVPMLVGDQVTGILSLQNVDQENAFDESHVRLLQTIAASMSVALDNARLFDETQHLLKESEQRAAELQIINSVQEEMSRKLDVVSIYELVGKKLHNYFQQADISIRIYDRGAGILSAPYLVRGGQRLHIKPITVSNAGADDYLLPSAKSILINEDLEQAAIRLHSLVAAGAEQPKSALYVPLMTGSEMYGAIALENMRQEHAFSHSDMRLLETLASSMSIALENARLWEQENRYRKALEHEFAIGRDIQAGFLPHTLPQPPGWEIAASLISAREVAGDYYDVFELPDGKIGLVIADVCDKGLGAALFMTLFRSLIRAVSGIERFVRARPSSRITAEMRLQNAISLTNNYIAETHGDTGMFATIFFGILDTQTGLLVYINGGHLLPLLVNAHGIKETLQRTGPAVGASPAAEYAIGETLIEHGDTLFAYTDGLTDTANPAGEYFNAQELAPLLINDQTLTALLPQIHQQVAAYTMSARRDDDITMLAVRRK